jgi:hypothetical protein
MASEPKEVTAALAVLDDAVNRCMKENKRNHCGQDTCFLKLLSKAFSDCAVARGGLLARFKRRADFINES